MKKTGAILGSLCVVGVVAYFLVTAKFGKVTSADFMPSNVVACVEQHDLAQLLDDFQASRLGLALKGMDPGKIATDLGLEPDEVNKIKEARAQMVDFFSSPLFQELLGQEFSIGLLPMADDFKEAPEKTVAESLLLIARPRVNADVLTLLSSVFTKKLEQASTQHGKYTLKHFSLKEGVTLSLTTIEGYVIAAFDDRLVSECLDRFDLKQGSLAKNAEYARLRQDFTGTKLFTYVSLPAVYEQAGKLVENVDPVHKAEIQKAVDQWKGWEGMAFGAWKEKSGIRDKAVVLFKRDKLDPLVSRMCDNPPVENKTLAMIPADVLGYYWTNTLDMSAFWDMLRKEMVEGDEQVKSMEQSVKAITGVELNQLFAMFGSEAVVLLKEIAVNGFIPLPNGALFFKVEQEEQLLAVLKTVFNKIDIPIQSEEYKGVKLNTLGMSMHPGMQPVYVLHQGYLVLASTVNLAKMFIDGKTGAGLVDDAGFRQLNQGLSQGLTQHNNSVGYIRFASVLKMTKDLANWGNTMLAMQTPEDSRRPKVLIEQVLLPLLDGLSMYDVIGSRSVIHEDSIIMESSTVLTP